MKVIRPVTNAYELLIRWSGPICLSLFLLLMRIVWGCAFIQAGSGKLHDISKPIQFFTHLGIPFPTLNAWLVAITECVGGLLLLVGLASRFAGLALTINMIVAYVTDAREALKELFANSEPGKVFSYAAFWFLVTAFLVLALGPGMFSADALFKRLVFTKRVQSGRE